MFSIDTLIVTQFKIIIFWIILSALILVSVILDVQTNNRSIFHSKVKGEKDEIPWEFWVIQYLGSNTVVGLPTSTFTIIYVYGLSIFKRKSFFMLEVTKRINYFHHHDIFPLAIESKKKFLHIWNVINWLVSYKKFDSVIATTVWFWIFEVILLWYTFSSILLIHKNVLINKNIAWWLPLARNLY